MYLESANTFINVRDIKMMYMNNDAQVIIQYTNDFQVTVNHNSIKEAQDTLMKLSRRAEEVQGFSFSDLLSIM